MSLQFMRELHHDRAQALALCGVRGRTIGTIGNPWEWPLAAGEVRRIEPAPVARWIDVADGRVWLTPTRDDDLAADHWLDAGERLALPAGSAWLLEAWPAARVAVHEAPPGDRRAR